MDVLPLLERLVSIDSVNPGLGGCGEEEIAMFVGKWARAAGLDVEFDEAAPGRPNVIVTAPGTGGGRSLLLNAHTDTVGYAGMVDPLTPRVEDGRLYGRGAYDMKGGLAACLIAAREAAGRELRGDVVVTAVVDEELTSIGTQSVLKRGRARAGRVGLGRGRRTLRRRLPLGRDGILRLSRDFAATEIWLVRRDRLKPVPGGKPNQVSRPVRCRNGTGESLFGRCQLPDSSRYRHVRRRFVRAWPAQSETGRIPRDAISVNSTSSLDLDVCGMRRDGLVDRVVPGR